ncbi:MAG: hypothetical protein WCI43_00360 [Candidatus Firestonebacteria bacterium]
MAEPREVREVHELLRRLQNNEKVDSAEVAYHLKKAVWKKGAGGMWIKKVEDSKKSESSLSMVRVNYEKELVAVRLNTSRPKR